MRFLSRLSDSISDFVSGSEADEVTGFVGRERLRLYSKNCFNVMAVALLDLADGYFGRLKPRGAAGVDKQHYAANVSAPALDEVTQFGDRRSHGRDVIDEYIVCAGFDVAVKVGAKADAFHRVGAGVEDALALHDALVRAPAGCDGQRGGEHLRDGVVTARFACMGGDEKDAVTELSCGVFDEVGGEVPQQAACCGGIAGFRRFVVGVPLECGVVRVETARLVRGMRQGVRANGRGGLGVMPLPSSRGRFSVEHRGAVKKGGGE